MAGDRRASPRRARQSSGRWPLAPFSVVVVVAQSEDVEVAKAGAAIYEQLARGGRRGDH